MNQEILDLSSRIKDGERPITDLVKLVGNYRKALILYSESISKIYGPKSIEGICECCRHNTTSKQITYSWRAIISYEILKNMGKAITLIPILILVNALIPFFRMEALFGIKDIQFTTWHYLCEDCLKRVNRNKPLSYLAMLLFGIPLVASFCCLVFFFIFGIICIFNEFSFTSENFFYAITGFLISYVLFSILKIGLKRIPVIITTPQNILKIENGGFKSFNEKAAGNIIG